MSCFDEKFYRSPLQLVLIFEIYNRIIVQGCYFKNNYK